jgi:hypothetical protein
MEDDEDEIYEPDENNIDTLFQQILDEGEDEYDVDCEDDDFKFSFE